MNILLSLLPFLPLALLLSRTHYASAAQYEVNAFGSSQLTFDADIEHHETFENELATEAVLLDPLEELRETLDVLQSTWFEPWVGTYPTAIDWTRAVLDTHVVASAGTLSKALSLCRSRHSCSRTDARQIEDAINKYLTENIAYYFGQNDFAIRNQAYDDMLWVVLGWLESVNFIKAHSDRHYRFNPGEPIPGRGRPWHAEQFISAFAHRARVFWELTLSGWDTELCDGGMVWNPRLGPYKNAITNELFITASVGMYVYFPGDNNTSPYIASQIQSGSSQPLEPFDHRFLKAAIDGYDWLKNIGMINDQGLYVDGFHVKNWKMNGTECNLRNEMVYTYNQGVILSGLRGLWESTANVSYLEDAHELVRNVMKATGWNLDDDKPHDSTKWAGLGRSGILEDKCDSTPHCNQDGETFKGIFFHHLALLCDALPLTPRFPGHTYGAGKNLIFLHHQSCKQYVPWINHNAKAALSTRDEKGRIGRWWGAKYGAEVELLPAGAVDYRNNASELSQEPWSDSEGSLLLDPELHAGLNHRFETTESLLESLPSNKRDLNDRSRGRTVETHSGGVAVLRALWEIQNTD